jgi:hypothetical protein
MSKLRRLNNKGFSHHLLLPVLVIMLIAAAGTYVLQKSRASVPYTNGPIYTGNSFARPDGSKEEHVSYQNLADSDGFMDDIVFAPDGARIAYVQTKYSEGKSVLKTAKSDGTDVKVLYRVDDGSAEAGSGISRPTWSSDGKYVAFYYGPRGRSLYAENGGSINVVRADGNTTDQDAYQLIPAFSGGGADDAFSESGIQFVPGTSKVAYMVNAYSGDHWDLVTKLCTVELNTDVEPSCTSASGTDSSKGVYPEDFRVSNTGNGLFITRAGVPGTASEYVEQFYKLNLTTGRATALGATRHVNNFYSDFSLEWSPDGKKIAYQENYQHVDDPSLAGTFVMDENASNVKKISNESASWAIAWQPIPVGGSQSPLPTNPQSLSCTVDGPVGGTFIGDKPNQIQVTTTSNSVSNISTTLTGSYLLYSNSSNQYKSLSPVPAEVPTGEVVKTNLPAFVVPFAEYTSQGMPVDVRVGTGSYCYAELNLPSPPLSINGRLNRTVPYAKEFTLNGITLPNKGVTLNNVSTNSTETAVDSNAQGAFTLSTSTKRELTNYYVVLKGGFKTPNIVVKTRAVINGKTVSTVKKGKKAVITGKYIPNKNLTIYMRKPGDQPGKFPTKVTVKTDDNGNFSYSFNVNKRADYYVQTPNGATTPTYTIKEK